MTASLSKKLREAINLSDLSEFVESSNIIDNIEKKNIETNEDKILYQLIKIKILKSQGDYRESTKKISNLIKKSLNLSIFLLINLYSELADSLWNSGDYEKCEEKIKLGLNLTSNTKKKITNDILIKKAELIKIRGLCLFDKGNNDDALYNFLFAKNIASRLNNKYFLTKINNNIGMIYGQIGELDKALDIFQETLEIKQKIGNLVSIGHTLNNIAVTYRLKGDLNKALQYHHECLQIYEEIGNKLNIGISLGNIGLIHDMKGEIFQAFEFLQKSLDYKIEVGNKKEIGSTYHNIGEALHKKGDLIGSKKNYQQAYELIYEVGNKIILSGIIFSQILVNLDLNLIDEAKSKVFELKTLNKIEKYDLIRIRSELGQAIMLKDSSRSKYRGRAESILENIIERNVVDYEMTIEAMVNLFDLLLFDLKTSNDESILEQMLDLSLKLRNIAKAQKSKWLLAESYLLESKLNSVNLNYSEANKYLQKALNLAIDYNLKRLELIIVREVEKTKNLQENLPASKGLDISISERLNHFKFEQFLILMKQKKLPILGEILVDKEFDIENIKIGLALGSFTDKGIEVKGKSQNCPFDNLKLRSMMEYSAVLFKQAELENFYGPFPHKISAKKYKSKENWNFLFYALELINDSVIDDRIRENKGKVSSLILIFYLQKYDPVILLNKHELKESTSRFFRKENNINQIDENRISELERNLNQSLVFL